jgi:uncharacterized protein (DUF2249 family)
MNEIMETILDVRPLLAGGQEPLAAILAALEGLESGTLLLRVPFEPLPLYPALAERGFSAAPSRVGPDLWEITIRRDADGTCELDLRDLPPPAPLQRVLEASASLGRGGRLCVHTRFHPVHLLDHLEQRGFECESEESAAGHWTTRIWRIIQA